ncbi:MAG: prepilin-type N-terminal cleavage/methylation domain-containing protein, partial [Nitrospirae bacterium]
MAGRGQPRRPLGGAGFTLVEVLVTLGLMALVFA